MTRPTGEAWADTYLRVSGLALRVFSVAVVAAMTILNTVNITSRALFHYDFEWTQELLMIGAMGLYFLSVSLICKGNMDIRIDAVLRILETPAGERKLRYRISPADLGVDEINDLCEQVQARLFEGFGIAANTAFAKRSTAATS